MRVAEAEGVRTLARGDEDVREKGGGETEAERDDLDNRGDTDLNCDNGFEGDTGSV